MQLLYIPLNETSSGSFGSEVLINSVKSVSFSSIKCSSRPPPEANRKGMWSCAQNPYSGWWKKINQILTTQHIYLILQLNAEDCHNFKVNLHMWWLLSRHITWEITVLFTPVLCTSFWWESSIKSSEILVDVVVNQCGHCYKLFTGSSVTIMTSIIKPEYNGFFWNTSYFDKPTKQARFIKLSLLQWIKLHVYEVWLLDENQTELITMWTWEHVLHPATVICFTEIIIMKLLNSKQGYVHWYLFEHANCKLTPTK